MADDAAPGPAKVEDPFEQITIILRTVLTHPAFSNGGPPFTRTLVVTDSIADYKITAHKCWVHPEWAVERGPIEAAKTLRGAARDFDQRRADARARRDAELRARLANVVEDIRRAGAEYLLDEVYGAPTVLWRALERRVRHER